MMSFHLFIARRLYSSKDGDKRFSRPAIRIAVLGVAIGMAVMILSICVVLGFKNEVSNKVVGFGSHVQVVSLSQTTEYEMLPVLTTDSLKRVVKKSTPLVSHMQVFAEKMGIMKTDDDFLAVKFKGLGEDYDTTFFHRYLVAGELPKFSSEESSNNIVVSDYIASTLGLSVGSRIYTYFIGGESMRARKFKVCAIYRTNLSEYDRFMVLTDIHTIRRLNNWESDCSSGIEIELSDWNQLEYATDAIAARVNHNEDRNGSRYGTFNIKELSPHLFAWLDVLDMNVVMILVLMICVSAFTIVSGLLIIMLERIQMIGVLKALGATNGMVRNIFRDFSVMLVGRGLLYGNAVGLLICYVQSQFKLISLDPTVYYLDSVPIHFNWPLIVAINVVTLIITWFVIVGSSYLMSISKPARTMKFD